MRTESGKGYIVGINVLLVDDEQKFRTSILRLKLRGYDTVRGRQRPQAVARWSHPTSVCGSGPKMPGSDCSKV
jgi:hypothetical protein